VIKSGPAEKAGLKRGDVVISYNDVEITDTGSLRNNVADTVIGKEVTVTVLREGERVDLTVKIGSQLEAIKLLSVSLKDRLGAVVRPLTAEEAKQYGLEAQAGVAIESLETDGLLAKAGFEVGDIILEVNDQPVEGVEGFANAMNSLKHNQRIVLFALDHHSGRTGYVEVVVQ
jgi:serine protease Do